MLKRILIISSGILLLGAGYFTYENWLQDSDLTGWSFIPENTLGVYEHHDFAQTIGQIGEFESWKAVQMVPEFRKIGDRIEGLDSVLNSQNSYSILFDKTHFLISLHLTAHDDLDLLYVLEVRNIQQQNILNRLQKAHEEGGYTRKIRNYMDFDITDMVSPDGQSFTYIFYKNFFIGSATAYLVEDAIRTLNDETILSFSESSSPLFQLTKLRNDQGNLYINLRQTERLVQAFAPDVLSPDIAGFGFLDLTVSDEAIQMDGFVFASEGQYLHQFRQANGGIFDMSEVISNNNAILYHYSFRDPQALSGQISEYIRSDEIAGTKADLLTSLDFDVDHTFHLLDEEIALGIQLRGHEIFKTLYLEVKDPTDALAFFQGIVEREARKSNTTVFRDTMRSHIIYKLNAPEYPMTILGPAARGFPECYFTTYRNFVLFSNSLPNLKEKLQDIENENTWLKSLRKVRFLEKTNQESTFSYFLHTPSIWNTISRQLASKWSNVALNNDFIFKSFENIAVQFNHVDDKFFTNIVLDFPENDFTANQLADKARSITFSESIRTKPFLVRNHNDGSREVVVQDSLYNLYLIDQNFNALWNIPIGNPIIGTVRQLDFYRNNKLQYVFITPVAIHVIDRLGNYVEGFPAKIEGAGSLTDFELIDYDGSRRYRYAVCDQSGNAFITDKNGNPLQGWDPSKFESKLIGAPRHFRIGGTDLIMVQLENGQIHSLNRRSGEYPGFPIDVKEKIFSPYHVNVGSRFNSTHYHTITESGKLISFTLKGRLLKREQLFKPSPQTDFRIVNDVGGKGYLILRKTANRYEILDSEQNLLFAKDYLNELGFFAQYYQLSSSKQYAVIGNPDDGFIYLYDLNGKLLTSRPLRGTQPVSMIYSGSQDEHQVYVVHNNELALYQIL